MFVLLYENKCDHLLGLSLENRGKASECRGADHFSSWRQEGKGHRRHSAGRMLSLDPESINIRVRGSPPTLTAMVPSWSLNSFRVLWEALLVGHQLCKWHQQWHQRHLRLCHSPTSCYLLQCPPGQRHRQAQAPIPPRLPLGSANPGLTWHLNSELGQIQGRQAGGSCFAAKHQQLPH